MTKQGGNRIGRVIDLVGQKFGRLTVIKRVENHVQPSGQKKVQWLCECECGNKTVVCGYSLKNGDTKSCGCLNYELILERNKNKKNYNKYDLSGEYGIGYTLKGEEFYFDLEDYDKIKDYCWRFTNRGYVVSVKNNEHEFLWQHRLVMDCPKNLEVDHIHQEDKHDNRKSNLRICTHMQNSLNRGIRADNKYGVAGVYKEKDKWVASITFNKKKKKKRFLNFDDAVKQRKLWEEEFFDEYSYDKSQKKEVI